MNDIQPDSTSMNIGIVGGGLMGMATAMKLSAQGHKVTVIESAPEVGGLSTWQDYNDFVWDKFYHVILPTDKNLIGLVKDLDMQDDFQWQRTYTGFYVDNEMHSISSNFEFLKFPLLSFVSKIRLAWTLLYGSRVNDWQKLEQQTCESWLLKVSGKNNYEKLWKPLLLAKLGESHSRVSAVFIWSYIKRMFSARDKTASAEQLGHVRGGYKSIFARMHEKIEQGGGKVLSGVRVESVSSGNQPGLEITTDSGTHVFDKVVCTGPAGVLEKIVDQDLLQVENRDGGIEYLGVVCVVVVSSKEISPFYVINIADEEIPFTGVIGMSTVVSPDNTGGKHLTYLPRYMLSSSAEFEQDDETFRNTFVAGLKKMFPELRDDDILDVRVHRAPRVQPLQVLGYSKKVPSVQTKHPDLYVLNTSQFVNATLNNNEVIGAVNNFCDLFNSDSQASPMSEKISKKDVTR